MFDDFFGEYIIILNYSERINSWLNKMLIESQFNQQNWELRWRFVVLADNWSDNEQNIVKIDDCIVDNELVLDNSLFLEHGKVGQNKQPKYAKIHIGDDQEKVVEFLKYIESTIRLIIVFFEDDEDEEIVDHNNECDLNNILGVRTRLLLDEITTEFKTINVVAECAGFQTVTKCRCLGASYAFSTRELEYQGLVSEIIGSEMVFFLSHLFNKNTKSNTTVNISHTIFSIRLGLESGQKIEVNNLKNDPVTIINNKFKIIPLALYRKNRGESAFVKIPRSGEYNILDSDLFIVYAPDNIDLVEYFREIEIIVNN